ncbi:UDP-glucuronosyltransferase 3A1 isoform X2 [Prionailurus iriomotensis]
MLSHGFLRPGEELSDVLHFNLEQMVYIHTQFDDTIKEHFPEGSRPELFHLQLKAELGFVSFGFGFVFAFAWPQLPNTVYVGHLMAKPDEPILQVERVQYFTDSGGPSTIRCTCTLSPPPPPGAGGLDLPHPPAGTGVSMAGQRVLLLAGFLLPGFLLSEAAKILTVSLVGGSHHLLLDQVSQILQAHGHNVTMLHQRGNSFISDFKEKEISYQVIPWLPPEDCNKGLKNNFDFFIEESLGGRYIFGKFLKFMEQVGLQCSHFLRSDIMDSLKNENFDLVIVENFDYCPSWLLKSLENHLLKNFLMFFDFTMKQRQIQSAYDNTIKEHFPEGSRPVLPLLPNTVYVGGLMSRPVTPVPQEFENFIAKFGDSGFVLVALGSMVSTFQSQELLREMNSAFAHLSQGVIWKYKPSHWPKDVKLAANVKIVDWLPQNDLLAHPRIRLFVTHGGMNSIMEAIQHGVPLVGIPSLETSQKTWSE